MSEPTIILNRYTIEKSIGQGGMGDVFLGKDTQTGDAVAIKLLKPDVVKNDPNIVERFEREGVALRKLNHPNIVKVLATAEENDKHYIIMEYATGGSLQDRLNTGEQLSIDEILNIMLDLADALTRAHRLDIIHRDLKPANVLLDKGGVPRLTDFGVARMGDSTSVTATGAVVGTLAYLPPEAIAGGIVDTRSDIWAFGVLMYEMLIGTRPFDADNTGALLNNIMTRPTPDMLTVREDIPWALAGLVYWMLEKDPKDRPDSVRIIGAMLENVLSGKQLPLNWFEGAIQTDWRPDPSTASQVIREFSTGTIDPRKPKADPISASFRTDDLQGHLESNPKLQIVVDNLSSNEGKNISRSDWDIKTQRKIKKKPRIFLSYRRADSIAMTGRLYDRLVQAFGTEYVFKDVDDIPAGVDFKQELADQVQSCDVLIAIIGNEYTKVTNADGQLRLFDPNDFVRIEVEAGLQRDGVLVIPALVSGASMPEASELPPSMHDLMFRNAAVVRNDPDFNRDVEWLVNQINNSFEYGSAFSLQSLPVRIAMIFALMVIVGLGLFAFTSDSNQTNESFTNPIELIEPVADDEFMVLLADVERLSGDERAVQRAIADDLNLRFVQEFPEAQFAIRTLNQVIRNADEANQIAQEVGAFIIVWGNYNDERVELNLQLGDTSTIEFAPITRDMVESMLNVRARLSDETTQSLFAPLVTFRGVLDYAQGDIHALNQSLRVASGGDATITPDYIGTTIGADIHRIIANYINNTPQAIALVNDVVARAGNPLALGMRGGLNFRIGNIDQVRRDVDTINRLLDGEAWKMMQWWDIFLSIYDNSLTDAVITLEELTEQYSDDWFAYYFLGITQLQNGDYEQARASLARSIELEPTANFPYGFAVQLALRDSDLILAQTYFDESIARFPDPDVAFEMVDTLAGQRLIGDFPIDLGAIIATFSHVALGNFDDANTNIDIALEVDPDSPDLNFIKGFTECSLGNHESAIDYFDRTLEIDSTYEMAYLLRANSYLTIGDVVSATFDSTQLLQGENSAFYDGLLQAGLRGDINCQNVLTVNLDTILVVNTTLSPDDLTQVQVTLETVVESDATATPESIVQVTEISAPTTEPELVPDTLVEPVADNEVMVLVAKLEQLGDDERNVQRFIIDDLVSLFEEQTNFSNIRIRALDQVITSEDDAIAIAESIGAEVIIWGNYDADIIELQVQAGDLRDDTEFFDADTIRSTSDVTVRMTNPRVESIGYNVIGVLNSVNTFNNNAFTIAFNLTIAELFEITPAEIVGNSISSRFHRFIVAYINNPEDALQEIELALEQDVTNPLLHASSSIVNLRLGNDLQAIDDANSTLLLAPEGWVAPYGVLLNQAVYYANDFAIAHEYAELLIESQPNTWFWSAFDGLLYYLEDDLDRANERLEQSLNTDIQANIPILLGIGIALREGDLQQAQVYYQRVLTEFPDPSVTNRLIRNALSPEFSNHPLTLYMEAFGNIALRQWQTIKSLTDELIENPGELLLSDIYLMQGLAYCNLGEYENAEVAYTNAIEADETYPLPYVLRAEVRRNQGNLLGATRDLGEVALTNQADILQPLIEVSADGSVTCENFFTADLSDE